VIRLPGRAEWGGMGKTLAAATASVALLAAGCGGDEEKTSSGSSSAGAADSAKVEIAEFDYAPKTIRVKAGGAVTFTNGDKAPHTAETENGAKGAFETGDLGKGASKKVTFEKPGRYSYHCAFHRFMTGAVEVVE